MPLKKRWCSSTVTSSEGFAVRFRDRATIVYTDKISRVYVGAEPGETIRGLWTIYPGQMYVGSLNGPRLEDETRRLFVLSRVREVFEFLRYTYEVR